MENVTTFFYSVSIVGTFVWEHLVLASMETHTQNCILPLTTKKLHWITISQACFVISEDSFPLFTCCSFKRHNGRMFNVNVFLPLSLV
ncbi:hypothetical protein XELAEV_18029694mg [Xenopus laevis]|uniref:Uncharacterized protein n=1 Tax=Xenopus laevis TaxID=8355 RepID=A0A974CSE6_XENLA|nr:hypothetical protein XELAEV_18029694mg [Xenopus laevis]